MASALSAGDGPVRSGEIDFVPLDELHRENLDQVLAEFSVDHLSESEKVQLNLAWHRLDAWPDAVAGLERLKSRYIIGARRMATLR